MVCSLTCSGDTCCRYVSTVCSYALNQLYCSCIEFTEVELILGGCCFKFPDQLGIWAAETGFGKTTFLQQLLPVCP